jgi:hypothetical protein
MFGIFAISLYLSRLEHVDIWLECYGKSCIACINCINCMTFGNGFPDESANIAPVLPKHFLVIPSTMPYCMNFWNEL